jgi:hypothetical protein
MLIFLGILMLVKNENAELAYKSEGVANNTIWIIKDNVSKERVNKIIETQVKPIINIELKKTDDFDILNIVGIDK